MPGLLPWLALLALLGLRFNHTFDAWYALVPVLLMFGLQLSQSFLGGALSAGDLEMLLEVAKIMAFGLSAMWLLFPLLRTSHRLLTFFKTVPALWVVTGITVFAEHGAKVFFDGQVMALAVIAGILGVALPLVLLLSAWCCRRCYSPARLALWTLLWSFGAAVLAIAPFWMIALIASGAGLGIRQFLIVTGVCAGIIFISLLPFMLLSFLNEFHRTRFKQWLGLEQPGVPPVASPAQAVAPA